MWAMPKTRKLLARHGTTFTNNVVNFPLCCPSRATYYTGRVRAQPRRALEQLPRGRLLPLRRLADAAGVAPERGLPDDPHRQVPERVRRARPVRGPAGLVGVVGRRRPDAPTTTTATRSTTTASCAPTGPSRDDYSTDVYARHRRARDRRRGARAQAVLPQPGPERPAHGGGRDRGAQEGTPAVPAPRDQRRPPTQLEMPMLPELQRGRHVGQVGAAEPSSRSRFGAGRWPPRSSAHYRGRMGSLFAVDDLVAARRTERCGAPGSPRTR